MLDRADYPIGPVDAGEVDALVAEIGRAFGASCEVAGSGGRSWVIVAWADPRKVDDAWVGKFAAYVAGFRRGRLTR